MIAIEIDHTVTDCSHLKCLLSQFAIDGVPFEIHCWKEETETIALALQYGQRQINSWRDGVVISGVVTPHFRQMLATMDKPADTAIYNKQMPFFAIFLGNSLASEHYGTENYILTAPSSTCQTVLQALSKIDGITVSA